MIIGTNFKLSSANFLDNRQLCKDYDTLIANEEGIIYPPGFEVFCEYENKYYQYISDVNGEYVWEERKGGTSSGTSASIKDDTISEEYTWSSAHIDSIRVDLEVLITQANDYVDEIDERMLFIEGKFQWFEYFDGSYESLSEKPFIPTKISELEDDSQFIDENELIITTNEINERINRIASESSDYNYLTNKPILSVGADTDLMLNYKQSIAEDGLYLITAKVGDYKLNKELVIVDWTDDNNFTLTIPGLLTVLNIGYIDNIWSVVNELHYGLDKDNAEISNSLNIGEGNVASENNQIVQGKFNEEDIEDKYINIIGNGTDTNNRKNIHTLDWEGNGWYGGKLSQEGIPTEDKDLVTKGYTDERFTNYATNERIDAIDKENARRDVIIEALVNGRKRTIETDGNDVDLMFSTEKDNVWIDKIEGDTMVNVCDQEEPIAITKSYTVEGTNHVPLQGEYDGKCRPVVQGNTLVNHNIEYDKSIIIGEKIDNIQGTEILNFEGTPNCEVKVDIDGHTAINLSTKKEDILCKSFDSVSGNEINLVAEENSVSDLVIQGNTMVNLVQDNIITYTVTSSDASFLGNENAWIRDIDNTKTHTIILNILENTVGADVKIYNYGGFAYFPFTSINIPTGTTGIKVYTTTQHASNNQSPSAWSCLPLGHDSGATIGGVFKYQAMIFEGDLTQTPELIPTEYVEGLQSTFEDKLIPYSIYNGDNLTSITETQYQLPLTVKSNTQYTVTTTANITKYQYAVYSADGLTEYLSYDTTVTTQTFTCDTSSVLFKVRMNPSYEGDDYSFVLDEVKDKFLIVEGDWSGRLDLLTEEYFGKYRVDMSSHGKNLFDLDVLKTKDGWVHSLYDYYELQLKPNTTYVISQNSGATSATGLGSCNISTTNIYSEFTVVDYTIWLIHNSQDKLSQVLTTDDSGILYVNHYEHLNRFEDTYEEVYNLLLSKNIQIEEGSTATEYEPYYGSSKTVYLNSPLLDGDELLTKDGKLYHYHKMGMVVLDGSEDWSYVRVLTNIAGFEVTNIKDIKIAGNCVSDKFPLLLGTSDEEGIRVVGDSSKFIVHVSLSKLSTTDVTGFKQWLSENPTTVVYELASPYYEETSSTEDMRFNIATTSTIEYQSNVPMANTQFLPYRNELPLLESSTQYRVTFDCDVEGLELMVSLGGTSQTITSGLHNELSFITPSLQTDGKLTIDGYGIAKIDNVLITKGDMEYKYFEGLKSGFEDGLNEENKYKANIRIQNPNAPIFGKGGRL